MSRRALFVLALLCGCGEPAPPPAENPSVARADDREPLGPDPRGEPTRLPILPAHGFNASTTNMWSFYEVAERLETHLSSSDPARRQVVFRATVPPYNSPEERARVLASSVDAVLAITGSAQLNLVAHSMGGLDARVLVDLPGYGDKIASVTTIASPHLGSAIADTILPLLPDLRAADFSML